MKKMLLVVFIILFMSTLGYFIYVNYFNNKIPVKNIEEEKAIVDTYYIYGNHLNINGNVKLDSGYKKEDGKVIFYLSEYINDGMYLDDIERGNYYLFLKVSYTDSEDNAKDVYKYYALDNQTKYKETTYYTLSKYNNEMLINTTNDNNYNTLMLSVKENKNKDVYDITIDPGHGGMDSGGLSGNYKEKDFTMRIATKVTSNLEDLGLKVKMTHKEGDYSTNSVFDEYNDGGRAVIPNEVKSKYAISIHTNKNGSSKVNGLEVYTPANINYDFAKSLAKNIHDYTGVSYSTNKMFKMYDGVYTHNFTKNEVASALSGYDEKGYVPYNVTTSSNYLYMIRETGGFMTGAYVDDSNPSKVGVNPYYDSNVGNEAYLLELGYLSGSKDLDILLNKEDEYVKAITDSIKSELGL